MGDLVLVTGANGYIAAHVVQQLLESGYRVRGTVRNPNDAEKVGPLRALAKDKPANLELVKADLLDAKCWANIVAGCKYVMHTASPFPGENPANPDEVIKPAVEGTLNVLRACGYAGAKRVVLTSSIAAIYAGNDCNHPPNGGQLFNESDWGDVKKADTVYEKSKILAERAAWDFLKSQPPGSKLELAVINPSLVLGPVCSKNVSSSIYIIARLLKGSDPSMPRKNFAICDVREVAAAHLAAMLRPEAAGHRHIISGPCLWFSDIAKILDSEFKPMGYTVATGDAPYCILWCLACCDPGLRALLPSLGKVYRFDNTRMKQVLGIRPRPVEETILDTAYSMIDHDLAVKKPNYRPRGPPASAMSAARSSTMSAASRGTTQARQSTTSAARKSATSVARKSATSVARKSATSVARPSNTSAVA